jgi:HAD superfamily hydrolase (TIGR01509 family)
LIVTHRHEVGMINLLKAHDMLNLFSGWVTADDNYAKKPDPAAFEATIKIHSLDREETLAVGDREIDILAGHAAGLKTCLFSQENPETVATLIVNSFQRLHNWLILS